MFCSPLAERETEGEKMYGEGEAGEAKQGKGRPVKRKGGGWRQGTNKRYVRRLRRVHRHHRGRRKKRQDGDGEDVEEEGVV